MSQHFHNNFQKLTPNMLQFSYLHTLLISLATSYTATAREAGLGINTRTNENERTIPLGPGSFIDLISKGVFVDKTLLIPALLNDYSDVPIIGLTSPQKWGKSVNLDMLKTFLKIQVYPNGTRILPISNSPNYELFTKGQYHSEDFDVKLENPLLISDSKYRTTIDKHLGQYPVIHLSFDGFSSTSKKSHITRLGDILASAYNEHSYLLNIYNHLLQHGDLLTHSEKFVKFNREKFRAYRNGKVENELDLQHGVELLCEELYDNFQKKVYVLVDEYQQLLDGTNVTQLLEYLLLSVAKNNEFVEKVILTGTVPLELKSNPIFMEFLLSPLYAFYGFTKDEMELIYEHYQIPVEQRDKIRYWYGGYQTPQNAQDEIFNPWSICNYINFRRLEPQWADSDFKDKYLDELYSSPIFERLLPGLLLRKEYDVQFTSSKFTYKDLNFLNRSFHDVSLRYLFTAGFLTVKNTSNINHHGIPIYYTYKIPNQEIISYFTNRTQRGVQNRPQPGVQNK